MQTKFLNVLVISVYKFILYFQPQDPGNDISCDRGVGTHYLIFHQFFRVSQILTYRICKKKKKINSQWCSFDWIQLRNFYCEIWFFFPFVTPSVTIVHQYLRFVFRAFKETSNDHVRYQYSRNLAEFQSESICSFLFWDI